MSDGERSSEAGEVEIQEHDGGFGAGSVKVFDASVLGCELEAFGLVDHTSQPLAVNWVVLDDTNGNHGSGPHKLTRVPSPGSDDTSVRPPTSASLARIDCRMPNPSGVVAIS